MRIEVSEKPDTLTQCNCSICYRTGALWAYYTRQQVKVEHPHGAVSVYMWGDKCIEFCHCNTCGCLTHYESVDKDGVDKDRESRVAINARMLQPRDVDGIRVRKFDGRSTWQFLDDETED